MWLISTNGVQNLAGRHVAESLCSYQGAPRSKSLGIGYGVGNNHIVAQIHVGKDVGPGHKRIGPYGDIENGVLVLVILSSGLQFTPQSVEQ